MALFSDFDELWVFNEEHSNFAGGIFRNKAAAEEWIAKHRLSGTLTLYPVDVGVYDLFIAKGWFKPKQPKHYSPRFIGGFTQASQDHDHYENGRRLGDLLREEGSLPGTEGEK
jgi:hypothetical protein